MSASGDSKNIDKKSDNKNQLSNLINGVMKGDLDTLYKIVTLSFPITPTQLKDMLDPYLKLYESKSLSVIEQARIGYLFFLAKEYDKALIYTQLAAEQGDPFALSNLGAMYYYGEGVVKNYDEAIKWFRLAADKSHPIAQFCLGSMYENGHGAIIDDGEARRWYQLAAVQGHPLAQNALGWAYRNSHGASLDYNEARRWYQLAANQGFATAQFNLAGMYREGQGGVQDFGEAAKWYRLAAESEQEYSYLPLSILNLNQLFQRRQENAKHAPQVIYHTAMLLLNHNELKNDPKVITAFQQMAKEYPQQLREWLDKENIQTLRNLAATTIIEPFFKKLRWEETQAQEALEAKMIAVAPEQKPDDLASIIMSFFGTMGMPNDPVNRLAMKEWRDIREKKTNKEKTIELCKNRIAKLKTRILALQWKDQTGGLAGFLGRNQKSIPTSDGKVKIIPATLFKLWKAALQAEKDKDYTGGWEEILQIAQQRPYHPYDKEDAIVKQFLASIHDKPTIQAKNLSADPGDEKKGIAVQARNEVNDTKKIRQLDVFTRAFIQHIQTNNSADNSSATLFASTNAIANIQRALEDIVEGVLLPFVYKRKKCSEADFENVQIRVVTAINHYRSELCLLPTEVKEEKLSALAKFLNIDNVNLLAAPLSKERIEILIQQSRASIGKSSSI